MGPTNQSTLFKICINLNDLSALSNTGPLQTEENDLNYQIKLLGLTEVITVAAFSRKQGQAFVERRRIEGFIWVGAMKVEIIHSKRVSIALIHTELTQYHNVLTECIIKEKLQILKGKLFVTAVRLIGYLKIIEFLPEVLINDEILY